MRLVQSMHLQVLEAEVELLKRWRAAGMSWADIGRVYGFTEQGMSQRFERLTARLTKARAEAQAVEDGGSGPR